MIGILACVAMGQASNPIQADPAFQSLKTLVGGKWEGTVEQGAKTAFTFHLEQGGNMIVAQGALNIPGKSPLAMRVSLGWDPDAKQVYYLDQHGFDTVYFGHVTKQGNELVWDFRGLTGDSGHYRSHETVTQTEYNSTMEAEQNGKWVDLGFHLHLHRMK